MKSFTGSGKMSLILQGGRTASGTRLAARGTGLRAQGAGTGLAGLASLLQ